MVIFRGFSLSTKERLVPAATHCRIYLFAHDAPKSQCDTLHLAQSATHFEEAHM